MLIRKGCLVCWARRKEKPHQFYGIFACRVALHFQQWATSKIFFPFILLLKVSFLETQLNRNSANFEKPQKQLPRVKFCKKMF